MDRYMRVPAPRLLRYVRSSRWLLPIPSMCIDVNGGPVALHIKSRVFDFRGEITREVIERVVHCFDPRDEVMIETHDSPDPCVYIEMPPSFDHMRGGEIEVKVEQHGYRPPGSPPAVVGGRLPTPPSTPAPVFDLKPIEEYPRYIDNHHQIVDSRVHVNHSGGDYSLSHKGCPNIKIHVSSPVNVSGFHSAPSPDRSPPSGFSSSPDKNSPRHPRHYPHAISRTSAKKTRRYPVSADVPRPVPIHVAPSPTPATVSRHHQSSASRQSSVHYPVHPPLPATVADHARRLQDYSDYSDACSAGSFGGRGDSQFGDLGGLSSTRGTRY